MLKSAQSYILKQCVTYITSFMLYTHAGTKIISLVCNQHSVK